MSHEASRGETPAVEGAGAGGRAEPPPRPVERGAAEPTHASGMRGTEIARRVRALIERRDGGDVGAAAERLGVSEEELSALTHGTAETPDLGVLRAVVRGYRVDACWLLTGERDALAAEGDDGYRETLASLLYGMTHPDAWPRA